MEEEPTFSVVGTRTGGRPKRFDGTPVSVRLPKDLHDELSVESMRRRMDLSEVIRERLRFRISKGSKA